MFLRYKSHTACGPMGELSLVIWKPGFILFCDTDFIFDLGQHLILGTRNANRVGLPFGGGAGEGREI